MRTLILIILSAGLVFPQAQVNPYPKPLVPGGGGSSSAVFCAATMSAGNLTCTPSPAITSYTAGLTIYFTSSASNSGATTINVSALGANNIFLNGSALSGTHFSSTTAVYSAVYDGTQFNMQPGDLTNGTTATTQSAGDNSTKVATNAGAIASSHYRNLCHSLGTVTTTVTIDPANGWCQTMTLTAADAVVPTFTQPSGEVAQVLLFVTQASTPTGSITWSGTSYWPAGIAPVSTAIAGAVDAFSFVLDGSKVWATTGQNFLVAP